VSGQLALIEEPSEGGGPTPEQARAIEARDRDVMLEAGAGTGKTLVLVERYCEAAESGAGIDGILAFTFTERAAAELRGRIRDELAARSAAAAARGEGERAAELATMSRDSERAWISTIHGFCRRLIAAQPIALGLDPRFRVLDAPEADRVARRAFDEALEELLAGGDPEATGLVAAVGIGPLSEIVRSAHDELRSLGQRQPSLPPAPVPDPEAAVRELVAAARAAIAETDGAKRTKWTERIERAAELEPASVHPEAAIAELELRSNAQAFSGQACRRYQQAWEAARRAALEHESADRYVHLATLVRGFGTRYAALKEERSGLDFEDLQHEAVRLLEERPAVADAYRERFAHVMVDEFQDTNELQLSLVRLLAGGETRVFTVGDEQQSVYGFRHADLRVFRRERERVREEPDSRAELLELSGNFRSVPGGIAAANFLGGALLEGFRPLTVAERRQPPEALADTPPVELLLTPGGRAWKDDEIAIEVPGEYPSPPDRIAEARFLAARLGELRDRGVPAGDMVVLLRALTHVAAYEDELEKAGLSPYLVGGRGYWSQQQVDDVRRLLGVVANPLDDHCLLGALASPACDVLPDTLWLLRQAAGSGRHLWPAVEWRFGTGTGDPSEPENPEWLDQIPEQDGERLRTFCATLEGLRADAPRLRLEELVDEVVSRLGYDLAALMMRRGTRRLANVRKLMRMARGFEAAEGRDLRGFLDFLDERAGRSDREGEAATEAEEHDGVRVMTVHAAKGLEFPVVAVADLGRNLTAGGRPPAVRIGRGTAADPAAPGREAEDAAGIDVGIQLARFGSKAARLYEYEALTEKAESDDAAESCRLAYVAATRAQDHLILSGCFDAKRVVKPEEDLPTRTPVVEHLMRALELGDEPDEGELQLPAPQPRPGLEESFEPGRVSVRVNPPDPDAFAALTPQRSRAAPEPEPPSGPTIAAVPQPSEPSPGHLSYSALAGYARCGYRFYAERVLGLAPIDPERAGGAEPSAASRRYGFGNAVHALLEWSARHRWAEPSSQLCVELLRREGLEATEDEQDRALGMVGTWLGSEHCAELRGGAGQERPEMPFLLPLGGSVVRGAIDLLVDTPDGPLVVDYKTDSLKDATPHELVDRYGVQRKIYALAAARGGEGPVRTAYAFLDQGGEVVEDALGGNELEATRAELEALVEGIGAGRFDLTDSPHWALCNDCPARSRLCSYPKEATAGRLR